MNTVIKNFLILFMVATALFPFLTARAEINVTIEAPPSTNLLSEECAEEFDNDTAYCLTPPGIAKGETSPFIDLLKWLLKFGFYAVGILAMLMIVIGGVQYTAAGAMGNPENIKDAQNRITMALGGLVLALSSWLILNTINPKLLDFELNLTGDSFAPLEQNTPAGPQGNPGGAVNPGGPQSNPDENSQNSEASNSSDANPTVNAPTTNTGNAKTDSAQTAETEYVWQENGCASGYSQGGDKCFGSIGNPPGDGYACCKKNN